MDVNVPYGEAQDLPPGSEGQVERLELASDLEHLISLLRAFPEDYKTSDSIRREIYRDQLKELKRASKVEYAHHMEWLREKLGIIKYDLFKCDYCSKIDPDLFPPCAINSDWCIKNLPQDKLKILMDNLNHEDDLPEEIREEWGDPEILGYYDARTRRTYPASLGQFRDDLRPIWDQGRAEVLMKDLFTTEDDLRPFYEEIFEEDLRTFTDPDGSVSMLPHTATYFFGGEYRLKHENGHFVIAELPGKGESYEGCGTVKGLYKCRSGDYRRLVYNNCGRWDCPICFHTPVNRCADRIAHKIKSMRKKYNRVGVRVGKIKHWVVSTDPISWTPERVLQDEGVSFRSEVTEIIKEYCFGGLYGGVLVPHYWRKKHLDGSECEEKKCGQVHLWDWGPHAHFIGYGDYEKSNIVYYETGFTLVKVKNKWGRKRNRSIKETVKYLLSHHVRLYREYETGEIHERLEDFDTPRFGFKKVRLSVGYTYLGWFSNCMGIKQVKEKGERAKRCPCCGDELVLYREGPGESWIEESTAMERYEIVGYRLNRKERKGKYRRWEYIIAHS